MPQPRIAFLGAGNMAQALIGGLIAGGHSPARLIAADPDRRQRETVSARHGIDCVEHNSLAAAGADAVVLAVKPQVLRSVCEDLATAAPVQPLFLSVAAGVTASLICQWLGGEAAVVRCMPNRPALIGAGVTALYANDRVSEPLRRLAEDLMSAVGSALWVDDEALLDPVTAISGSGPAYFFLLMEIMEQTGIEMALPADVARRLTRETALGAARMALAGTAEPAQLRAEVTSPGGTTAAALEVLEGAGLRATLRAALLAARDRSIELASQAGGRKN